MKLLNPLSKETLRHLLMSASVAVFAAALMIAQPLTANADQVTPPSAPTNIQVEEGNVAFLVGHAVGTQNYICLPTATGVAFKLFTPQATLFNDKNKPKQITTHFFSPNPDEDGKFRPAWEESDDSSMVWGEVKDGHASSDPAFVAPGAIPWLKITRVGSQDGPTGGGKLSKTTFIQRVNTTGGIAPATGCTTPAEIGNQAFVPYTADYFFYRSKN